MSYSKAIKTPTQHKVTKTCTQLVGSRERDLKWRLHGDTVLERESLGGYLHIGILYLKKSTYPKASSIPHKIVSNTQK